MVYDVHIFAVIRVLVAGVEASSQADAIHSAVASIDLYRLLRQENTEYAEEINSYLVDEVGDEQHCNTRYYRDKHHLEVNAADERNGVEVLDRSRKGK